MNISPRGEVNCLYFYRIFAEIACQNVKFQRHIVVSYCFYNCSRLYSINISHVYTEFGILSEIVNVDQNLTTRKLSYSYLRMDSNE